MKRQTYPQKVAEKLRTLKTGESFNKKEYVKEVWRDDDYFMLRTFDVAFASAKKLIPEQIFKTIEGNVTRIK